MMTSPKKCSESFAEVTVIDSQYNHFQDYVDIIRVYKCKLCPFCSPLEHVITSHMSEVHFPRRCFLCKQCLFVFESREKLIEHIEAGHGSQSLNCSFGEPPAHGCPTQASQVGSVFQEDDRLVKMSIDDGGVNGQSVTSSTSNLANIPDEPVSLEPNKTEKQTPSPAHEIILQRPPSELAVAYTSSPNRCTSKASQGRQHEKSHSGQLMGLGVRKMLQRRHSLAGSHPNSELRLGFFSTSVKTEPVSPVQYNQNQQELAANQQEVRPIIRNILLADSLSDSSDSLKRDSTSRGSVVSCPDEKVLRMKDTETIINTLPVQAPVQAPVQRDIAVVRGIPFKPVENTVVQQDIIVQSRERSESLDKKRDSGDDQQELRSSTDLLFTETYRRAEAQDFPTVEHGIYPRTDPALDAGTDSELCQKGKPPTSLRDIVSHVMEKHRHNSNETISQQTESRSITPPSSFLGHSVEFHGPSKGRPRSYSITEGEISSFREHHDDTLEIPKEGVRSNVRGPDVKQHRGIPSGPRMSLWYPYHQHSFERDLRKYPRTVPWPYGHFPVANPTQNTGISKIPIQQSSEESVLYSYLRNRNPGVKRRRNSIGVMNSLEPNTVGLSWPPQLPPNELVTRFGPGSQSQMHWGAMPNYMHQFGLSQLGEKSSSPNSIPKHGSQVSPNKYGEYLSDIERKEGNQSNTSDQTSSEGTQDLAQVDDITRQVNSAIRSTGGFYSSEQNDVGEGDGNQDFDGEDDENPTDDGRKRSRKSTFNIYREIPERKRKLDRVEEEKIKKSYNADGSFDYFTLTGWKAYKCDLCKKRRFKTASELEDHKRLKHTSDLNQSSRKLVFHSVHVEENDFEEST